MLETSDDACTPNPHLYARLTATIESFENVRERSSSVPVPDATEAVEVEMQK